MSCHQFPRAALSFGPLVPSRGGVAMNPAANTRDLPSPTLVLSDLSGHLSLLGFGRR